MYLNVKQRGDHVATFRWIEVCLMETLAAWVPSTPEMEAKLVFGAHIWDVAQHADILGKRTHELRLPLQDSLRPSNDYAEFLAQVAQVPETNKRIAAFYRCLLPGLQRRLQEYSSKVDPLLDGPTLRVIDRILSDSARMIQESEELYREFSWAVYDTAWLESLRQRELALRDIVVYRQTTQDAPPVQLHG